MNALDGANLDVLTLATFVTASVGVGFALGYRHRGLEREAHRRMRRLRPWR